MAQSFYKGDEVKFAIELTAQGFSMDDNNFDIEVASPKVSIKASKNAPSEGNTLIIFKESGTWYGIVDTTELTNGELRVIATAHIPDTHANDGIRRQSESTSLGTLKNK